MTAIRRIALPVIAAGLLLVPAGDAAALKLRSGMIELSFDNAFGLSLVQLGVTPSVIAPATQDSVTFTLPIVGGNAVVRKTTIRSAGGFQLIQTARDTSIRLSKLTAVVRHKKVSLRGLAALDGRDYDAFEFAAGRAKQVIRTPSAFAVTGITLHLTEIGSTALNSQFGAASFETGSAVGSARIRAKR
jgi:hypothetical protein